MLDNLSFQLPVVITKQGRRFVAYTPALDISTSAQTKKNVEKRFVELVAIFFQEIIEAGTADEVLMELGWKKIQRKWNPPQVVSAESMRVRAPAFVWWLMPRIKSVHWKEFEKFLLKIGCKFKWEKGDHRIYWKPGIKRPVVIPRDTALPAFIILNNLRVLGISREEYLKIIEMLS